MITLQLCEMLEPLQTVPKIYRVHKLKIFIDVCNICRSADSNFGQTKTMAFVHLSDKYSNNSPMFLYV